MTDLGESLVAAYLRHVRRCEVVLTNVYIEGTQGELDVVGLELKAPQQVWLCEVTTHVRGMNNPVRRGAAQRMMEKIERASRFAVEVFPEAKPHFEVWSPKVRPGLVAELEATAAAMKDGLPLELVINAEYTRRVQELIDVARVNPSTTGEGAFRMLQILTHVEGELRL